MGLFDNLRAAFSPVEDVPGANEGSAPDYKVFGLEKREDGVIAGPASGEEALLRAFRPNTVLTKEMVLNIPTVEASLNMIKGTMHALPIRLFEKKDGIITEIEDDPRVRLLNVDPGDTLGPAELMDAMIEDYYLDGRAYAYIEKKKNRVVSLRYVRSEDISVTTNCRPIFKDYDILCDGKEYEPWEFLKILRSTRDGASGEGMIKRNTLVFQVAYNSMMFENNLVKTGGNKKGFLKSTRKLEKQAMEQLREAWKKLYSGSEERMVILNDGMDFKESSATSVELQLNENKKSNALEICKLFGIPEGLMTGASTSTASEDDKLKFAEYCILPLVRTFEKAMNRDLLTTKEQGTRYFSFNTDALTRGPLKERMTAYQTAIKNNVYTIDEVRKMENLPALELDLLNLNLGTVLYSPKTKIGFVPNTAKWFQMDGLFDETKKITVQEDTGEGETGIENPDQE